jgi:hypothetical protein
MKILKVLTIFFQIIFISGFTTFTEMVPAPRDMPKRTEDKNAGIVIPSFESSPYDIIENSFDSLDAFMAYPEEGIFMSISTSNFDLNSHKLTFNDEKFGFILDDAYRVRISFSDKKKPQKILNFSFSPFEITDPKLESKVVEVAKTWVNFFDSQGWNRVQPSLSSPYGSMPESGSWPFMIWESDNLRLALNIHLSSNDSLEEDNYKKYYITIVFYNNQDTF